VAVAAEFMLVLSVPDQVVQAEAELGQKDRVFQLMVQKIPVEAVEDQERVQQVKVGRAL
jgi:hypothetical protein